MNEAGWVFIVDRKKDLLNASRYKVWPRVEDGLSTHPAIREAAVVGIPDDYRAESVKAVVMAAYEVPRVVTIIDDLPKTPTAKILRRVLRAEVTTAV